MTDRRDRRQHSTTPNEPCTGCGRTDYVAAVVTDYGDRFCAECMRQPVAPAKARGR